MTPDEFDRLANRTRLRARGREAARMVLVDGRRPADVARSLHISAPAVHAARNRILRKLREDQCTPPDWVAVTVLVPPGNEAAVHKLANSHQKPRIGT